MATTHLDRINQTTRETIAAAKLRTPIAELEAKAAQHTPRGWANALKTRAAQAPAIIAELKKASPSKGLIRADFSIEPLAKSYTAGGATVLSVLTDEPYFQGSLRNLELTSASVPLPCLRKDFMLDDYQFVEARAHKADAILLIAASLSNTELRRFTDLAHELALDVLVEVHNREELDRVTILGADAIGVNNRDLHSFEVKLETSLTLIESIPHNVVRVAESGITTAQDLATLRKAGFDAFLIGESFMRQPDPGAAITNLLTEAAKL